MAVLLGKLAKAATTGKYRGVSVSCFDESGATEFHFAGVHQSDPATALSATMEKAFHLALEAEKAKRPPKRKKF